MGRTTKYLVGLGVLAIALLVTTVYYMQDLPERESLGVIIILLG
jgi:hypothetical protein